jgi:hypothetical protein
MIRCQPNKICRIGISLGTPDPVHESNEIRAVGQWMNFRHLRKQLIKGRHKHRKMGRKSHPAEDRKHSVMGSRGADNDDDFVMENEAKVLSGHHTKQMVCCCGDLNANERKG